jgi:hypothetical protein
LGRKINTSTSNETNSLGFNNPSFSVFLYVRSVSGKFMDIWALIGEVGAPIAGALVMGAFIFIIMKQIMSGVVNQIGTLKGFCEMLVTRIKTMNNDIIRLDTSVSSALELTPDLDRIARAENFVEDGKLDVRRD